MYEAQLALAEKEIKRLSAIVEQLPKTADGVPVVPGMKLYPLHPIPRLDEPDHGVAEIGLYDPVNQDFHRHGTDDFRVGLCYSSPGEAGRARFEQGLRQSE